MSQKILIIDDDPVILKYLENLFQDNGYDTLTATSGLDGYEVASKAKPDLITLDLEMPDEWGPRFYRRMSKNKEFKDIPVIVISGLTGSRYSLPKAAAHLDKPFDPKEVLEIVRRLIG